MSSNVLPSDEEIEEIVLREGCYAQRVTGDGRLYLAAGYALLMQVAHPTVGAGVREHSTFEQDPWGRLLRTMDYLYLITLPDREAAAVGRRVRELHKSIKGTKPDGSRYHALEPEAYAWVHATLIEATVRAHREFVAPMSEAQAEAFYADWMPLGRLLGVRERDLPETWAEFGDYFRTMSDERLERNETVDAVIRTLAARKPPPIPVIRGMWPLLRLAPARAMRLSTVGPAQRAAAGELWSRMDAQRRPSVPTHGPHIPRDDAAAAQATDRYRSPAPALAGRGDQRGAARCWGRQQLGRRGGLGPDGRSVSAGGLLSRALAAAPSDGAEAGDEIAERILDAALIEGAAKGLERITMDAVAVRARVGRMTVYRRFGGREGLVSALTVREAGQALAGIAAAVDPEDDVPTQVADGFVAALEVARTHPLLQRLARYEPETLLATVNDPADPLFEMLRAFVSAQLQAGAGAGLRADPDEAAEILVRIGLSYLLIPGGLVDVGSEADARRLAETLIAPIVAEPVA